MLAPDKADKAEPAAPSIEDMSAHDFQTLLPQFKEKIEELSNRQLKRVTNALIEYPLHEANFRFSYPQERELFNIGSKLLDCKFVIMKAALEMSKDQIDALMAEQAAGDAASAEEAKLDESKESK